MKHVYYITAISVFSTPVGYRYIRQSTVSFIVVAICVQDEDPEYHNQ